MAVTHLALSQALCGSTTLDTIPDSRMGSPAPRTSISTGLGSPLGLTPVPSRTPSTSPSFHSALSSHADERPKPPPLCIPDASQQQPLFSAYPVNNDPSLSTSKLYDTVSTTPITTPVDRQFTWSRSGPMSSDNGAEYSSSGGTTAQPSAGPSRTDSTLSLSRRRSLSTVSLVKQAKDRSSHFGTPQSPVHSRHRRRASLGSGELDIDRWREMGTNAQFDDHVPLEYTRDGSEYTLQSVSAVTSSRPLVSPPLSQLERESGIIGLAALSIEDSGLNRKPTEPAVNTDAASFVSDPSTFSPSATSKSLPSTKTSLSRSARSGKEGHEESEREALGGSPQVMLDRRRMLLLEIVETEVTYVHDLHALAEIYLPQLAVLPHVSERIHALIARNTTDLLLFHMQFAKHMVDILKYAGMGYDSCDADTIERVTKQIAELFVREVTSFTLYKTYCAGSTAAAAMVRNMTTRPDFEAFEKRCQYIASTNPHSTLSDMLSGQQSRPCQSRFRFKDILITPIQRVCRYPLLLASLLADVNRDLPPCDVIDAVEEAQSTMRAVAENADDARRRKEAELKTASVIDRLEPHPQVTQELLHSLGNCRLIGTLDVLYHHPTYAPLGEPVKVKYLGAFLYRGYLVLAKIRKSKTFEVKHYLPLEVFELVDITEGFLPHSIRLNFRDHHLDLAASCDAEKELWATELCAARDESTVPAFELPSSVSLFAPRSRHSSMAMSAVEEPVVRPSKRHTMIAERKRPTASPQAARPSTVFGGEMTASPVAATGPSIAGGVSASPTGPVTPSTIAAGALPPIEGSGTPEYRASKQPSFLLRRASLTQRLLVDRALADIFSESLATARSKMQLDAPPSNTDPRRISTLLDTPMLRRRRSMAEVRSQNVITAPEVRGAVMPARSIVRARSYVITDGGHGHAVDGDVDISRNPSFASLRSLRGRPSSLSLRRGLDMSLTPNRVDKLYRRKTASISSMAELPRSRLSRTRSMPTSPVTPTRRKANESAPTESETPSEAPIHEQAAPSNTAYTSTPADTDDDYIIVATHTHDGPSKASSTRSSTRSASTNLKRSLSFFSRKPSLSSLASFHQQSDSDGYSGSSVIPPSRAASTGGLTRSLSRSASGMLSRVPSTAGRLSRVPSGARTAPTTPESSPAAVKRRRSVRLFGPLRGFTPI